MLEEVGRPVLQVPSNHESIENSRAKRLVSVLIMHVLSKSFFSLIIFSWIRSLSMPLENTFLFHGHQYRNFGASWFWRHYSEIFRNIGLSIYRPVGGCFEIINQKIVTENNLLDFAQSCLRSNQPGKPCGTCWKCFRKIRWQDMIFLQ